MPATPSIRKIWRATNTTLKCLDDYNETEILKEMLDCDEVETKPVDVRRMRTPFSSQANKELNILTVPFPVGTKMAVFESGSNHSSRQAPSSSASGAKLMAMLR